MSRAALAGSCVSQRTVGVGVGRHEVLAPISASFIHMPFFNCRLCRRFSLADLSSSPSACCSKTLSNTSRYHNDALAASMTSHVIVPLCATVDIYGFRIMCTGPTDDVVRRVVVGRVDPLADVQGGHGFAAAEGG